MVSLAKYAPPPWRERRGAIAAQWGGEGDLAVSHLWQRPPHPPRFAGPLPLPQGERGKSRGSSSPSPALRRARRLRLRPAVAQTDRAVEHQPARRRILVAVEIAEPLELHRRVLVRRGERGLEP